MKRNLLKSAVLVLGSIAIGLTMANLILFALGLSDPPIYRSDPDYGYLALPDQWPSTRGIKYHINQAGLRGADFSARKAGCSLRMTFIGDSVTFGGGVVADKDTFVARTTSLLSRRFGRKLDAVNISAPGWGVQNMSAYIARNGIHGGDLVIWTLPYEDLRRPKNEIFDLPTKRSFRIQFLFSKVLQILQPYLLPVGYRSRIDPNATLTDNLDAFKRALELIRSKKVGAIVIFFPEGNVPAAADQQAYQGYQAVAASYGVETCDVCSEIEANGGASLFYDRAHLNGRGHDVAARLIAECVARIEVSLFQRTCTQR